MIKSKTLVLVIILLLITGLSFADAGFNIPNINLSIGDEAATDSAASTVQIIVLLTILTLAPSILIMVTCFTRIIIIFSFLRRALALQQTPPNQVLVALALFLTFFIMSPVFSDINENAYQPLVNDEINQQQAIENAIVPLREFMLSQMEDEQGQKSLSLFIELAGADGVANVDDIPLSAIIPAFMIHELTIGFLVGFFLFIPFIVIDMVVASTLMSLGMMMLPPVMISLPFKVLLFIMIDGWNLIVRLIIDGF